MSRLLNLCMPPSISLTQLNQLSQLAPLPRQRIITLAFLFPSGEDNTGLNKLVARLSKYGTCHVELVFEDDMSFSVFAGTNVFFKQRTFSNPDYTLVSLSVSHLEYSSLYSFCQSAVAHELHFSDLGMVMCYVQPRQCPVFNTAPSLEAGHTFCSKIVTEALQFAETPEVDHLIPCTTSPSCLYEAVKVSSRQIMSSVGYRQQQLRKVGVVWA